MKKLDRYIGTTVFLAMFMVFLVLGGLDFIFSLFDEIGATDENYQLADAVLYSSLLFPRHVYELFSLIALIGALAGLGVIASNNELIIMQAAGVKVSRIVWSVMRPTALVMFIGLILAEFVAPTLELRAEVGKAIANGEEMVVSDFGFWRREGNTFMHFNAIEPDGKLYGVSIYEYDQQQGLVSNTFAEYGEYQDLAPEPYWLLINGNKTTFFQGESADSSQIERFESEQWNISLAPELLKDIIIDSEKMSISDLYLYAQRFEEQGQDASPYLLAFWKKVLQPLATASLVLMAASFIFGPLRESTTGSRIFTGTCFGIGFLIFQDLLNTVSLVYRIWPFYAVILPILIVTLIGLIMLRKAV